MILEQIQERCELGQRELMDCNYLAAERILAQAEQEAWTLRDFDTLSRLYMPLQEARRQRRQRCGEGVVCLDLTAQGPDDAITARHVLENYPAGQLLVAGWGTIAPAVEVRQLADELELYAETFLAAAYSTSEGDVVAIIPHAAAELPRPNGNSPESLRKLLPPNSLVLHQRDLPRGGQRGNAQTYSYVMELWERLHAPFLAAADAEPDPVRRIEAYRLTIQVDYACELAHQKLADVAHRLARAGYTAPTISPPCR